ncbi:MAG: leucine-rich repeat domain-containing protein [Promethearchaeota archaeon]
MLKFKELKYLVYSYNHLLYLPNSLGDLNRLEILDLSHNRLSDIPEIIGKLKALR